MSGTLYLIPNRISFTAPAETLPQETLAAVRGCRRFLAENARSARAFLKAIGHPGPIAELSIAEIGHEPDPAQFDAWLAPVAAGEDAAVVSESGCPGVADPGAGIVARAHALGIRVRPMVGPCSILLTLMASGMNGQRFWFLGYLPIADNERAEALRALERASRAPHAGGGEVAFDGETQLFIETPYRNNRMLEAMTEIFAPDTRITAAVDVTGDEESIRTLTAREWKPLVGTLPKLPTVFAVLASPSAAPKAHKTSKAPHPAKSLLKGSAPAATHKKAPAARGTSHVPHPRRAPKKH